MRLKLTACPVTRLATSQLRRNTLDTSTSVIG